MAASLFVEVHVPLDGEQIVRTADASGLTVRDVVTALAERIEFRIADQLRFIDGVANGVQAKVTTKRDGRG